MPAPDYEAREKVRIKLCRWLKHDMKALEYLSELDEHYIDLQEAYENLDPRGEK
jgi:hypothetical protein